MGRNNNQVATIEPVRMQMPANVAEDYGINEDGWRALVGAVFPNAKSVGAVTMALAYCKKHRLDVFQRVVHIVPMWNGGEMVETVWPGIAQLRVIAQRQEDFAGYDDCEFGPVKSESFKGKSRGKNNTSYSVEAEVEFPEWAQFTVYKIINGERIAMPGPKVWFMEAFSNKATLEGQCPNEMWQRRPRGQLEKCAEAAALRRAFPDVLGNEYAMEEMEGRNWSEGAIDAKFVEVTDDGSSPKNDAPTKKPRREDYEEKPKPRGTRVEEEQNPLDGDMIPEGDEWNYHLQLSEERLKTFIHVAQVSEFERDQSFRTDMAPPEFKEKWRALLDKYTDLLDDSPDPDEEGQQNGGDNEKAGD